jgi:integrase
LNALTVSNANTPGMIPDGGGLYLQVAGPTSKSWIYRYTINRRVRVIGLGSACDGGLTLAQARAKRDEYRNLVNNKIDPLEQRDAAKKARVQAAIDASKNISFADATAQYIADHRAAWRSVKHAKQWASTLRIYAEPTLGHLPVAAITTEAVLKVLQPIWSTKNETAGRLRGRIETILDWATVHKYRTGENPARWRGHLKIILPSPTKLKKVRHHPALPFTEIGAFMVELRKREGISAAALEFTILTAARTNEVLGARWEEIDLKQKTWTVPGERMKGGKEHRVPLSAPALAVVEKMRGLGLTGAFVFPNIGRGRPLSNMALLKTLERMGRPDLTTHGFRSTFRDWAAECTNFQNEVVEKSLAHAISDKVEAAYRRGDLLEKRRRLMDAWAEYCAKVTVDSATVVPIRAGINK